MLLCVLTTPFPPRSSKYLIHINSVILTTVQPETVNGKYNPLDAEGRESLWKIQCMTDSHAKIIVRAFVHWLETAVQIICG